LSDLDRQIEFVESDTCAGVTADVGAQDIRIVCSTCTCRMPMAWNAWAGCAN
jgi:hypothetical protein